MRNVQRFLGKSFIENATPHWSNIVCLRKTNKCLKLLIDRQIFKNNSFVHCLISLVSLRHLRSTWCLSPSNGKTKLARDISERIRYSSRHLNNQSCYEATRSCTTKTRLEFHWNCQWKTFASSKILNWKLSWFSSVAWFYIKEIKNAPSAYITQKCTRNKFFISFIK